MLNLTKKNSIRLLSKKETLIVVGFFILILLVLSYVFFYPNYYSANEPVEINIPKGSTLHQVIDTLYEHQIIPNKTNMRIAAFLYGADNKIKAGRYKIPNGLSYLGLIELLMKGEPKEQILVTIPEGIEQAELAGLLKEKLGIDSVRFMKLCEDKKFIATLGLNVKNLEGYLLPESYYFYYGSSEEEVIEKLISEMNKLFNEDYQKQIEALRMDKNEILTLASIVEGESNKIDEFKTISGVYYNRLRKGMLLQADPTIQYLIRHRKNNKIYYKDLEIESPYNTYIHTGLPPTPINNPGKDAIIAALFPEKNNYFYFVADGNGGHWFSRTHQEHLMNVSKYRRWQRYQK